MSVEEKESISKLAEVLGTVSEEDKRVIEAFAHGIAIGASKNEDAEKKAE